MNKVESRAEVFNIAFKSLSKAERKAVLALLLEAPEVREDLLDLAIIEQRKGELSKPFRDHLAERKQKSRSR
ncbi:MAG: hypothetical protein HY673_05075 [Chloroflexi bacterium]|nr:hypothetical protein [Chloroflexota bacterium]